MFLSISGELAAVKILENIHEIIEEVEVEYKIFMKYGDHPNMPKFHGLYLRHGETGSDDQLWFIMEVGIVLWFVIGKIFMKYGDQPKHAKISRAVSATWGNWVR